MYPYQNAYYQQQPVAVAQSINVVRYPAARRPRTQPQGARARLIQVVCFVLFLCLVFGVTFMLGHFLGLDNLAQVHGADYMIDALGIEPLAKI